MVKLLNNLLLNVLLTNFSVALLMIYINMEFHINKKIVSSNSPDIHVCVDK